MMQAAVRLIALAAGLSFAVPAPAAQICAPPQTVASVGITPNVTGFRQYVSLTIAGTHAQLRLDTGAEQTSITPELARALKLDIKTSAAWTFTATGAASNRTAVTDITLGSLVWKDAELTVLPPNDISPRAEYAGLFGTDFLARYDVSLDFEHHKLELIDPNHCPNTPPNWPGKTPVAIPFKLVASHIELPVTIDGHTVMATLDTGAARAVLLRPVAEQVFDLVMGGPDTPPSTGTLNNLPGATVWHHIFQELKIGGVTITKQQFSIIPDMFNAAETKAEQASQAAKTPDAAKTSEPAKPEEYAMTDVIIGMEVLKNLRLYINYKDRILYIAP